MTTQFLFDTHVHYNLEPLWPNWQRYWEAAQEKGVQKALVVGTSLETSQRALEIAKQETHLFAAVGIHPEVFQDEAAVAQADQLSTLFTLSNQSYIKAIGEVGLDYFRLPQENTAHQSVKELQQQGLIAQLTLAQRLQLPVILHVRDADHPETPTSGNAYWDLLAILKDHLPSKWVLHCASGPQSYVAEMVKLGGYVSFAGNVTYPSAHAVRTLLSLVPSNRVLIETDAPFLAPQQHRGKMCEPLMIADTASFLVQQYQLDLSQLYINAEDFLNLRYNTSR